VEMQGSEFTCVSTKPYELKLQHDPAARRKTVEAV